LKSRRKVEDLFANAKSLTAEAIARDSGAKPTITEARKLEAMPRLAKSPQGPVVDTASTVDEAQQAYLEMMRSIAAAANESADRHG